MKFNKSIVYFLLSIFALIFIYNYVLPLFLFQNYNTNNMGMGMGRHMWEGMGYTNQYNINNFGNIVVFLIVILATFLLLGRGFFYSKSNKCKKCGLAIESDLWKVCPRCGNQLSPKKEE